LIYVLYAAGDGSDDWSLEHEPMIPKITIMTNRICRQRFPKEVFVISNVTTGDNLT
jgi:hypothetical protein